MNENPTLNQEVISPAPQTANPPTPDVATTAPSFMSYQIEAEKEATAKRFAAGAQWFYWIAGLSMINSIIQISGGQWRFIFGLGIVDLAEAVVQAANLGLGGHIFAFMFALTAAAVFCLFGYLSRLKMRWPFYVGMTLYTLDALLLLLLGDYLSAAVHGFVLYQMFNAVRAIKSLQETSEPV
jgi:hypothetical protein